MHELSQPAFSNPCDQLRCSHLCLLAPALRPKSGTAGDQGTTAVCRCPKGMFLKPDKATCTLPKESSFILLLSHSVIYQVSVLMPGPGYGRFLFLLTYFFVNFTDLSRGDASGEFCPEENAHQQTTAHSWGNWGIRVGPHFPGPSDIFG